jgi:hypothetical protein
VDEEGWVERRRPASVEEEEDQPLAAGDGSTTAASIFLRGPALTSLPGRHSSPFAVDSPPRTFFVSVLHACRTVGTVAFILTIRAMYSTALAAQPLTRTKGDATGLDPKWGTALSRSADAASRARPLSIFGRALRHSTTDVRATAPSPLLGPRLPTHHYQPRNDVVHRRRIPDARPAPARRPAARKAHVSTDARTRPTSGWSALLAHRRRSSPPHRAPQTLAGSADGNAGVCLHAVTQRVACSCVDDGS